MTGVQLARFLDRIEMIPFHTCWEWAGARAQGYGQAWADGRVSPAHRLAYEHFVGPIPDGLVIDHRCRNHGCVNPAHLEPVTNRENVMRGISCVATGARATECPQGHPYTPENTLKRDGKYRGCRECRNRIVRTYRRNKKLGMI